MSLALGLLTALLSAVLWGSMFVPMKKIKNPDMLQFHAFMSAGIFLSTIILISAFGLQFAFNIFGLAAGLLWSAGNILSIFAIRDIGLSKAPPIWMSIVMLMNFAWGVLLFREPLASLLFGIAGIVLLITGAAVVSMAKQEKTRLNLKGTAMAAFSGFLYGNTAVMFKYFNMSNGEFLFSMAVGILLSGLAVFAMKFRRLDSRLLGSSLAAGAMWNVASLSSLYSIAYIGLAVSIPLTQLALLFSALWGLFYFREMKGKARTKVLTGAVVLLIGGVLLALSK